MNKLVRTFFGVAVATVALGAMSACSDEGGDTTAAEGAVMNDDARWHSPQDARRTDAGTAATPSIAKDLVSVAVADGRFAILAKALTDTKLVATLQGAGPFTVFAPTDAAFQALGEATLKSLTPEQLTTILTYHVISADLPARALKSGPVDTVSGLSAFVSIADGKVKVNDANVTTANVGASNGVIHVIDRVLLPPNLVKAAEYAGSFSTLLGAASRAGLAGALGAPDANLTVFAPTDGAFAEIASTVAGLSNAQLADVLKYHVVAGKVLSSTLSAAMVPTLLTGKTLAISLDRGVKVNDAHVVVKDVVTTNGVIHVIDKVLLP